MAILSEKAIEKSTYVITASFTDKAGNAATPDSIKWTLSHKDGTVVNSRSQVTVASPASSVDIVLSGLDLAITSGTPNLRLVTVEAVYDSTEGTDLPLKQQCEFEIIPLAAVS